MRISGVAAGAALLALGLAGCGTGPRGPAAGSAGTGASASPSGPSATGSSPGANSAPSGAEGAGAAATPLGPCAAAAMTGRVTSPDAAAGNRYAELIVTNTGGGPCDASGFVGLRLYDSRGRALPTDVRHEGPQLRNIVIVPPGGHAYARLHWGVVTGDGDATEGPCQPSPATAGVTMPRDAERFRVAWGYGPVCQSGRIDVRALRAGLPPAGPATPGSASMGTGPRRD